MKLQVAIDRVDREKALSIINKVTPHADIIEIGTSLIKDFGLKHLDQIIHSNHQALLLGDIKTNDEGEYEFIQGYKVGFDILTAMGSSSYETLNKCYHVSKEYGKDMMIDLLECTDEKIKTIASFPDAIYCLHTSIDKEKNQNPAQDIKAFKEKYPQIKRIAVAGGITLEELPSIKEAGPEIVIVGSGITKANDMTNQVKIYKEALL
ncbi:3-hexulose-6-phosphate synthase [Terrilactibacillus sp. BCM23-1]|uniref:3-hexulose-6-phosphate synthase n=1 Tax=Terrilactibacillus tamarindi TaxID=2599694 RepID=A0A6N8CT51_9BACI|nr:orotidine 5'-phosphate decarboxylase / HUMPS family protein [Terrilactibacillus tamarindi]MTT32377.1 3-hexulose-6-phosphate synthase [Terrilactibacillus tamarindi]